MSSMPYMPHDPIPYDSEAHGIDNAHKQRESSLYIIYPGDYDDHPTPKEYRDPWLQRVVDLSSFVDALQTKHRSLRDRWSDESSDRIPSQVFDQIVPLERQESQNERRSRWMDKFSGRLFRGSSTTRGKSVASDGILQPVVQPVAKLAEPYPPAPQSLPARRLRRTPALRELSCSTPPSRNSHPSTSSSSASGSTFHRRVVSEPPPPPPKPAFFNAFMADIAGDVSSSIRISDFSAGSSQVAQTLDDHPTGESSQHYSSMPPFSSPSSLSASSSSDFSSPPTPPPKHSTPRSKLNAPKRSAYCSPLDILRYYPQSEFGTDQGLKTPMQALRATLGPDETPTVRSAASLKAQHVTTLPQRQSSCKATPVLERPSSPESCTCRPIICNDDIAFSPYRPRLMNGAGYFHVKLVSEDQGDGCTVETWKIYACEECNRQSRPPGTRATSIVSESVTSTNLYTSTDDIDYDAYTTADEGEHDDASDDDDP